MLILSSVPLESSAKYTLSVSQHFYFVTVLYHLSLVLCIISLFDVIHICIYIHCRYYICMDIFV